MNCQEVVFPSLRPPWVSQLEAFYPQCRFTKWSNTLVRRVKARASDDIWLCQGDTKFYGTVLPLLRVLPRFVACGFGSTPDAQLGALGQASTFTVSAVESSGVLDGTWWFLFSAGWGQVTYRRPVSLDSRRLRHIVSTTSPFTGKRFCAPPADDSPCYPRAWFTDASFSVLDWNGLLPIGHPLTPVRCPTVFSTTQWVTRGLTVEELGKAFDVSATGLLCFNDWPYNHRKNLPFLSSVPQKVLLGAWTGCCAGGGTDVDVVEVGGPTGFVFNKNPVTPPHGLQLGEVEPHAEAEAYAKATKADDAEVPEHLWDDRIWAWGKHCAARRAKFEAAHGCPLQTLRQFLLGRWKRGLYLDFVRFMKREHGPDWVVNMGASQDREAGAECIDRAMAAGWWEWTKGSRLFFWRWAPAHRITARDGFPAFVKGELPKYLRPQPRELDELIRELVMKKLKKVRDLGYVLKGLVSSLTSFFAVPKGESDIRMVYDATKSGLNKALWAPNFGLPTVDALTRGVTEEFWMGDLDIGDMFLNFMLDPKLQAVCGIDLRPYFEQEAGKGTLWERWVRCMMGLKISPYVCIKGMLLALERVLGNRFDAGNAYAWARIKLNIPGHPQYDPTKPTLWKEREDGSVASITVSFVDDFRSGALTEGECWTVMHTTAAKLGYLGIQVAARKTRPPSKRPGAWAGSVVITNDKGVAVKVTLEKWNKAKELVKELQGLLEQGGQLKRKRLEQVRGFLIHIAGTYPALTPFLKGLHLTIDGWRPDRDEDGWKVKRAGGLDGYWCSKEDRWIATAEIDGDVPDLVEPATRLTTDVDTLQVLTASEHPPLRYVRSKAVAVALYGFGDASGVGFGSTFETREGILYRHGVWGRDDETASSNYRELGNLVFTLEDEAARGVLDQAEVYIFTDNSTAESVFYKGNSTSKKLFDLVVRLRRIEMSGSTRLKFIHVAGTRMIRQGTDALSRGDLTEGVMGKARMLDFVPLHKTAIERQPSVLDWIRSWTDQPELQALSPEEWFGKGHGTDGGDLDENGVWYPKESDQQWLLWAPPPGVCDVALEELNLSRHKRTHINHVFVAPRLMTFAWRKRLQKLADFVFEVPVGARSFWPKLEHEPLIVGVVLRFLPDSPWQVKQSDRLLGLDGELRKLWKAAEGDERSFLLELCQLTGRMDGV